MDELLTKYIIYIIFAVVAMAVAAILCFLAYRRGRASTIPEIAFFDDRRELQKVHETLSSNLKGSKSVDVVWVCGQEFYDKGEQLHVIKRLILPHLDSASLKFYAKSADQGALESQIRDTTRRALNAGAEVRWSPEYVGLSFNLVDTAERSGWVHIELVPYFSRTAQKPSLTVFKSEKEAVVLEYQSIFDRLWESCVIQPREQSPK